MKDKTSRKDSSVEKWKPKRKWISEIIIKLDKPRKTKYKYYVPKSPEEEKRMEDE